MPAVESFLSNALFVTGTDTAAGKTFVSTALLRRLRSAGRRAIGMKPVASGCEKRAGEWRNEDAESLLGASAGSPTYALINPFALPLATAPEIAAAAAGVTVELDPIERAFAALRERSEYLLVEGVGGWMAPLGPDLMQRDLALRLRLPVLLVVGLRLGCLNHALLSCRAIVDDGLPLLGWVASAVDPALEFADEYLQMLRDRLPGSYFGLLAAGDDDGAGLDLDGLLQACR